MSPDAVRASEQKGRAGKIAKWTAILVAATAFFVAATNFFDAANTFVAKVQLFTCRFGVIFFWCSPPPPDSRAIPQASADPLKQCQASLEEARQEKVLHPVVTVNGLQLFEKAVINCGGGTFYIDQNKLTLARDAANKNDIQMAYDLYDQAFSVP